MKTNYEVTFGYKAVVTVNLKAENEEEAKKLATEHISKYKDFGSKSEIQSDSFKADGILNIDATWNSID